MGLVWMIHWHTSVIKHTLLLARARSPTSLHPPFTHYSISPRSLVCDGQTSPHKSHAYSLVLGTAVINNNSHAPLFPPSFFPTISLSARSTSARERVLFIGTQFSNLYTAVDTPAMGRVVVCLVFVCLVCVCKYVLGHSRVSQPLNRPVMPPPAPWRSHFAVCLPDLPHTPP